MNYEASIVVNYDRMANPSDSAHALVEWLSTLNKGETVYVLVTERPCPYPSHGPGPREEQQHECMDRKQGHH